MEETVDRILDFLQKCGNGDIEAGMGQILGLGSDEDIIKFRVRLMLAIGPKCLNGGGAGS